MPQRPECIAIDPDDYHASDVGWTKDNRQFIITTPFVPALGGDGCEYLARYLFDSEGALIDAKIQSLGPRASLDVEDSKKLLSGLRQEMEPVERRRVLIRPFSVEFDGVAFGLVERSPEEEGDVWAVEMQPGNYMAFFEPWDSGEYDT